MAVRQTIGAILMASVAAAGMVMLGVGAAAAGESPPAAATGTYIPFHHVPPVPNPSEPSSLSVPGEPTAGNASQTQPAARVPPSPPPPRVTR
jgi:hypothetical protein